MQPNRAAKRDDHCNSGSAAKHHREASVRKSKCQSSGTGSKRPVFVTRECSQRQLSIVQPMGKLAERAARVLGRLSLARERGRVRVVQGNWRMLDPTPLTSMLSPSKGRGELSDGVIILSLPRSKRAVAFIEIDC